MHTPGNTLLSSNIPPPPPPPTHTHGPPCIHVCMAGITDATVAYGILVLIYDSYVVSIKINVYTHSHSCIYPQKQTVSHRNDCKDYLINGQKYKHICAHVFKWHYKYSVNQTRIGNKTSVFKAS